MSVTFWCAAFAAASLAFHKVVDPLILQFNGSVTSGRRSPAHNAELPDSSSYSLHLIGCAVDVIFTGPNNDLDCGYFVEACIVAGLEVVLYETHVHVEFDVKSVLKKMIDGR